MRNQARNQENHEAIHKPRGHGKGGGVRPNSILLRKLYTTIYPKKGKWVRKISKSNHVVYGYPYTENNHTFDLIFRMNRDAT